MNQSKGLKIGVLTFHRCINYGSYWQARCLVEALIARGHNATILDHDLARINIAEWKCAYRPTLPTPVAESDYPLYRQKITHFFRAFEELPLSQRFPLDQPEKMEDYELVVVGSDEVWNLFHPWYAQYPVFFGEGIRAERVIAYAASFGNYPANWKINDEWAEKLYNFEAISVRGESAQMIVKNAIGIEAEIVLDPCLQFDIKYERRSYDRLKEPYIAVYGHNFSDTYTENIRKFAASKNIRTISIGYRNDWADEQWIVADPHDFTNFIAGAEAVATNFFHGCVFSLVNEKPFVCEITPYRSQKIENLMKNVGGEGHLANRDALPDQFQKALSEPLHPQIISNINHLRQVSNEYLNRALDAQKLRVA